LRDTPIAAAIWLQVMPRSTQARSASMRSAVQVAFGGAIVFAAGAIFAGSSAALSGGREGGDSGSDGAIDGAIDGAADGDIGLRPRVFVAAAKLGRRQGVVRAQRPIARRKTSKRKIGARR
jgi:hypothetical protein